MSPKNFDKIQKPQQLTDNPYRGNMDDYNANLNPDPKLSPTKHKK